MPSSVGSGRAHVWGGGVYGGAGRDEGLAALLESARRVGCTPGPAACTRRPLRCTARSSDALRPPHLKQLRHLVLRAAARADLAQQIHKLVVGLHHRGWKSARQGGTDSTAEQRHRQLPGGRFPEAPHNCSRCQAAAGRQPRVRHARRRGRGRLTHLPEGLWTGSMAGWDALQVHTLDVYTHCNSGQHPASHVPTARELPRPTCRKTFDRKQDSGMQRAQLSASKQNLRCAAPSLPLATGGSWWKSPERISCGSAGGRKRRAKVGGGQAACAGRRLAVAPRTCGGTPRPAACATWLTPSLCERAPVFRQRAPRCRALCVPPLLGCRTGGHPSSKPALAPQHERAVQLL